MIGKLPTKRRAPSVITVGPMRGPYGHGSYFIDCNGPHGQSVACYVVPMFLRQEIEETRLRHYPATVEFEGVIPAGVLESLSVSD